MRQNESNRARTIQPVVKIRPLKSAENDFAYWQSQSYQLRYLVVGGYAVALC